MKKKREVKHDFARISNKFTRIIYRFRSLSTYKHLLILYLLVTFLGAGILMFPISQNSGVSVNFMDALFVSASAFSDTGLISVVTSETWSYFGQAIIAILILNGGFGLFSLKVYIINILLKIPMSFKTNLALSTERGTDKIGSSKRIIKVSITIFLILILFFSMILTICFYISTPDMINYPKTINPHHDLATSFRFGLFHTISAINNAGFDIIGSNSLAPYYTNYTIQIIFIILLVIGGIGYPVIYDVYQWIIAKFSGKQFRWSLFTKLSMITYALVTIFGISLVIVYETTISSKELAIWHSNNPLFGSHGDKIMAFIFNTFSTRNAGFATISMYDLSFNTQTIFIILMFIGSAPCSTAGGIRTTTLAIVLMGLWNRIRGRVSVRVFKSVIAHETVERAFIVFITSLFLLLIVSGISITSFSAYGGKINTEGFFPCDNNSILAKPQDRFTFIAIIFETASAFGTTGLTMGITNGLSVSAKIMLIITMFIGQLGISSSILVWGRRNSRSKKYTYVTQDVTTG